MGKRYGPGLALLTLALFGATRARAGYIVTDVGGLLGPYASGFAVNDAGQLAGGYWSVQDGSSHLVLYPNGKPIDVGSPGSGSIYGELFAAGPTFGLGLNNAGQVAGSTLYGGDSRAFLYSGGKFSDLGLSGSAPSGVGGINGAGQVVGWVMTNQQNAATQPFLYSGGKTQLLPFSGVAAGINDAGQIVGYKTLPGGFLGGAFHAFLYSGGNLTDLGSLPGAHSSAATAINNVGQVVGWSYANSPVPGQSSGPHAFLYSGGKMIDLGTLGGSESHAKAINDAGQVVGNSTRSEGSAHAFLFTNGKMFDLNSLISPESHWQLTDALAINNRGQILGWGVNAQGVVSQVLLTPVAAPEPGSLTLLGIGAVGLAGYARRKRKGFTQSAPCTAASPAPGHAP